jgi:hypothetical protein
MTEGWAISHGSDDEFDHDDEPVVAQSAAGAYVMVWRWVYKDEIRLKTRESKNTQRHACLVFQRQPSPGSV